MRTPVLTWAAAVLAIACSASTSPVEHPSGTTPKVFVEAALTRLDADELALVRTLDMDRLIVGNSADVLSTVGGLAEPGVPLVFDPGSYAKSHAPETADVGISLSRLEVTPALTSPPAVRVDMKLKLDVEGTEHSLTKADVFSGPQLMVWDTQLKTSSGESIVLLVQPIVIESERELKAILTRRAAGAAPAER